MVAGGGGMGGAAGWNKIQDLTGQERSIDDG